MQLFASAISRNWISMAADDLMSRSLSAGLPACTSLLGLFYSRQPRISIAADLTRMFDLIAIYIFVRVVIRFSAHAAASRLAL